MLSCCCDASGQVRQSPMVESTDFATRGPVDPTRCDEDSTTCPQDEYPEAGTESSPVLLDVGTEDSSGRLSSRRSALEEITVTKHESGLGLAIDITPIGLQVIRIGVGAVRSYNAVALDERRVALHDLIVKVNGAHDPKEMAGRMNDDGTVTLQFVRLERRVVTVDKGGASLGMSLLFHEASSSCLFVKEIFEGAVHTYNRSADEDSKVLPEDFIERVNGVRGPGCKLLQELKNSSKVVLVLLRQPASA